MCKFKKENSRVGHLLVALLKTASEWSHWDWIKPEMGKVTCPTKEIWTRHRIYNYEEAKNTQKKYQKNVLSSLKLESWNTEKAIFHHEERVSIIACEL